MTPQYVPGRFKDLANTVLGRRVWRFLTQPATVLRLETAWELGRSAVDAIASRLAEELGDEILGPASGPAQKRDRWHRMIADMTKQILARQGTHAMSRSTPFSPRARDARPVELGGNLPTPPMHVDRPRQRTPR